MPHLLESLAALGAMMVVRTRKEDDDEDLQPPDVITRLAKQTAPMLVVAMLTGGAMQLSPMASGISAGNERLAKLEERLIALDSKVAEISTRRNMQVGELERRILACEISLARSGHDAEPRNGKK